MSKKSAVLITGIIFILIISYYLLGGFRPVTYTRIPESKYIVIGKEYIGANNTRELESLFNDTKSLISKKFEDATLVILNDDGKYDDENNEVGYFIGLLVENVPASIPEGYSIMRFGPVDVIRARIVSHNLVMPKPDNIKQHVIKMVESGNEKLSDLSIEKYLDNDELEVDFLLMK
jgi:hypothetical protein